MAWGTLMIALSIMLIAPIVLAIVQALGGHRASAERLNTLVTLTIFLASVWLYSTVLRWGAQSWCGELFHIDALNGLFLTLTCLVAWTTSIFSGPYMRVELDRGRLSPARLRLYHSVFAFFLGTMLLALSVNNMGLMWVAMEAATLSTVLMVSLYRTPASLEAAWKYFILCGVGIAQALFGLILLYLAADRVIGGGEQTLLWTHLWQIRSHLDAHIMAIAFIFLLLGWGTKMGLVPLHGWLPDAHAEGPTPISAVLCGLLLNVATYAMLRCKILADGVLPAHWSDHLLLVLGVLTLVVAVLAILVQKDVKRLFAYSSIEHMGLITLALSLSGVWAHIAALLHMTLHALIKSAIFFSAGHAAQKVGSQKIADLRALVRVSPRIGWSLLIGVLAILGLPPFGMFRSEFMIFSSLLAQQPSLLPLVALALLLALLGLLGPTQSMTLGQEAPTHMRILPYRPRRLPLLVHLGLAAFLGLYLPPVVLQAYQQAAIILGGS